MTQGVQDNRDFYRIQDNVLLEYKVLDHKVLEFDTTSSSEHEESIFPIPVTPQFHLLNELNQIDSDNAQLLRNIAEKDRNVANYLSSVNHKLELIARVIAGGNDELEELLPQKVTLSEGGLSFNNSDVMKMNTRLAIKLVLLPSYVGLLLYGTVVNCNEHINGDYLINLEFEKLQENDRHLIARHVLQHQAKARRESADNDTQ